MAVVLEGDRERIYVSPRDVKRPEFKPAELALVSEARRTFLAGSTPTRAMITGGVCSAYGLKTFGDLFTDRQLVALTTFADLARGASERCQDDAIRAGITNDDNRLDAEGRGASAYAQSVSVFLGLATSKLADYNCTLASWSPTRDQAAHVFKRQALPMVWDFPEVNPFAGAAGDLAVSLEGIVRTVERSFAGSEGYASQDDAQIQEVSSGKVVSTDPPYYDNIGYADLSDFFYIWLRRSLSPIFPGLFGTIVVPKGEELVATPYRHGGKKEAEDFFLAGMTRALRNLAVHGRSDFPTTVYYAFKQSDTNDEEGTASTGWETFLQALMSAGFGVTGTWPIRTERESRSVGSGTNALASSIVLVCRPRGDSAPSIARKEFLRQLERALPAALTEMTADPIAAIAPVDLAQAVIGPGMGIFSQYKEVLEADGRAMSVHSALIHINKAVDAFFGETEGDLDADTRFSIDWFQQHGFDAGAFGEADVLARAKGTSVDGVREAGVIASDKGKVRLLRVKDYPQDWDPATDDRTPIWEACHQMCRALAESEGDAGRLLARMPERQDGIRQLAYRLYTLCERKGWAEEARAYNELITSWPSIVGESHKAGHKGTQIDLL